MRGCQVGAPSHACIGDDGSKELFVEVQDGFFLMAEGCCSENFQNVDS